MLPCYLGYRRQVLENQILVLSVEGLACISCRRRSSDQKRGAIQLFTTPTFADHTWGLRRAAQIFSTDRSFTDYCLAP